VVRGDDLSETLAGASQALGGPPPGEREAMEAALAGTLFVNAASLNATLSMLQHVRSLHSRWHCLHL